jgi:hypothetical protein
MLGKESLNNDGHQFHQYQQNEQSPLILTELTEHKKPQHMTLEIEVLAWYRYRSVVGLNWLMESQPSYLEIGSPTAIYIYKQMNGYCFCFHAVIEE